MWHIWYSCHRGIVNNKCAPTFSITELTVLNHGTDISYASSRTIDVGMDRLRATYPLIDCSASPIKLKKYLPNFSQVFSPKGLVLDKRLFRLKGPTRNKNTRCDTGIPGLHEFTCENRTYPKKKSTVYFPSWIQFRTLKHHASVPKLNAVILPATTHQQAASGIVELGWWTWRTHLWKPFARLRYITRINLLFSNKFLSPELNLLCEHSYLKMFHSACRNLQTTTPTNLLLWPSLMHCITCFLGYLGGPACLFGLLLLRPLCFILLLFTFENGGNMRYVCQQKAMLHV